MADQEVKNGAQAPASGGAITRIPRGGAVSREQRQAFLAKIVPVETMTALQTAHDQFFGALSGMELTVPERTVLASAALVQLKEALRGPILDQIIMPLMNSAIGFDTDRNPQKGWSGQPYDKETVLNCAAEAWLSGLPMVGNRWNIIANGMYPRKEGFEGLLAEVCRFTAVADVPPITKQLYEEGGYLKVPVTVKYLLHTEPESAEPQKFVGIYSVRLNRKNAVAVEACEGKAKRKAFRDLWRVISGVLLPDADDPDAEGGSVHQVGSHFGETSGAGASAAPSAESIKKGAGKAAPVGEPANREPGEDDDLGEGGGEGNGLFE
jgi:hypothetical protein